MDLGLLTGPGQRLDIDEATDGACRFEMDDRVGRRD